MKIKSSIILPTFNEVGNIVKLVEEIRNKLAKERINNEIIIVDDDSPDKTGLLAQKYFSKNPSVRVIIRKGEKSLAIAIKRGLEVAVGEVAVVMDTDFNHSPDLVPELIKKCQKYDFVVGSRFVHKGGMQNKTREFFSKIFNMLLMRPILGSPVHDNLSGFFAVKTIQLNKLNFDKIFWGYGDYFIRLIYLAKKQGFTFTELPSFYKNRQYGTSKSKFLEMFYNYLVSAIQIRFDKNFTSRTN